MSTDKKNVKNDLGFYFAVADVDVKFGKIDKLKPYDSYRIFTKRFTDSPEMALLAIMDDNNDRWQAKNVEDIENILKDTKFDPENNEYTLQMAFTTNMNVPTEDHFKKFAAGEYEFFVYTCHIQVLKTELVVGDRRQDAVKMWTKKLEKEVWNRRR